MRLEFDGDTGAAIEALRRDHDLGLSEAVNQLIRRALVNTPAPVAFRQRTHRMGIRIDVSNVADALEILDGLKAR